MNYWDKDFSTAHMMESDPFADKVMVDGFIVPIQLLPPEVQEMLRREKR